MRPVQLPRSVVARLLIAFIVVYRSASSNRRPACRFMPSCSEYAQEALECHGARTGLALAVKRLVRCRPGGAFGFDPVPDATAGRAGEAGNP
jgi:hypothetical protein